MKYARLVLLAIGLFVSNLAAETLPLDSILVRVDRQFESYQHQDSVTMDIHSTVKKMNGKWQPNSVMEVEKTVTMNGGDVHEEIHKVTETKKGKVKDLTEDARKDAEKKKKKRDKDKKDTDENNDDDQSISMGLEDLWMTAEYRQYHQIQLLPDTSIGNRDVYTIHIDSDIKSDSTYKGLYYIDKNTFDLVMINFAPTKNPKMVKELQMKMWFYPPQRDMLLLKKSWTKVYASLVIKKFRMILEENYSYR